MNLEGPFGYCAIQSGMGDRNDFFLFVVNSRFERERFEKYKQRPGRDIRSVVVIFSYSSSAPSRISNPGRRSDSPPY